MIIVTGGAGFIGSNLVAALEARGHADLVVCDRLGSEDKWRNLAKRELRAIVPPEGLFAFLDANRGAVEVIFHMGAISATTETDADLILANNFVLSQELWQWCADHAVRLVYASSAATYGDGAAGFDDDGSIAALGRLRPLNAYGWSKHLFDRRVARAVGDREPAPPQWAGLKFFNVYGPNEYHKGDMASVVSKLHPVITAGEPARLFRSHRPDYADGGQTRDFVWVGDCVAVMLWLLNTPAVSGLFNVGSGCARSFLDLALATFDAAGIEPQVEYFDMPEEIRDKYQYFTQAETARLRAAGFAAPLTSLEDGIRQYVRGYLAAPDPYL
ncbi:MAG: ADP-glyceromanno-heptose 6-epimerase [Azospirillum sp.]|nr:ADP-glyceromanno-heptose 6-epimerase [Azospirillum sp.]